MVHVLFLVREPYPTSRPDVVTLFGKYLPRLGVRSTYVGELNLAHAGGDVPEWGGGSTNLCLGHGSSLRRQWGRFWHQMRVLWRVNSQEDVVVQVRDLALTAAFALALARVRGVPFSFWMSFPMTNAQIERGRRASWLSLRERWFPLIQGGLGHVVLHAIVLRYADHVFVQSERMRVDVVAGGVRAERVSVVPMGFDDELLSTALRQPRRERSAERPRVVYLGVLEQNRHSHLLLEIAERVREHYPNLLLELVGDAEDPDYGEWFRREISARQLGETVEVTGWVSREEAWERVRQADVGVSLYPRGALYDSASPTKVVESLALGVPMVVNDQPEQCAVITASGGGICVTGNPGEMALAIDSLLSGPTLIDAIAERGRRFVFTQRTYGAIAAKVAANYNGIVRDRRSR